MLPREIATLNELPSHRLAIVMRNGDVREIVVHVRIFSLPQKTCVLKPYGCGRTCRFCHMRCGACGDEFCPDRLSTTPVLRCSLAHSDQSLTRITDRSVLSILDLLP